MIKLCFCLPDKWFWRIYRLEIVAQTLSYILSLHVLLELFVWERKEKFVDSKCSSESGLFFISVSSVEKMSVRRVLEQNKDALNSQKSMSPPPPSQSRRWTVPTTHQRNERALGKGSLFFLTFSILVQNLTKHINKISTKFWHLSVALNLSYIS